MTLSLLTLLLVASPLLAQEAPDASPAATIVLGGGRGLPLEAMGLDIDEHDNEAYPEFGLNGVPDLDLTSKWDSPSSNPSSLIHSQNPVLE